MQDREHIYIGGAWVRPMREATPLAVVNPANAQAIARVPACSGEDVATAVAAARAALTAWSALAPAQRAAYLQQIAQGLKARADELARLITSEVGTPIKQCGRLQVAGPLYAWGQYARLAAEFAFESQVGHSLVVREPVGVVAAITPWNYPLHQVTCKSRRHWRPAAPWCSSRPRRRRCRPCCWPKSSMLLACRRVCSTWSPATGLGWARPW